MTNGEIPTAQRIDAPTGEAPKYLPQAMDPATLIAAIGLAMKGPEAVKAITSLVGGGLDPFQVTVADAYPDDDEYILTLEATNVSAHGAYIEDVSLEAGQTREGRPLDSPRYRVVPKSRMFPGDEAPAMTENHLARPILVPPGKSDRITIRFPLAPHTWAERDAFGRAVVRITMLNEEVSSERHVTFAIRRPQTLQV
jgi:hypothetical protein